MSKCVWSRAKKAPLESGNTEQPHLGPVVGGRDKS